MLNYSIFMDFISINSTPLQFISGFDFHNLKILLGIIIELATNLTFSLNYLWICLRSFFEFLEFKENLELIIILCSLAMPARGLSIDLSICWYLCSLFIAFFGFSQLKSSFSYFRYGLMELFLWNLSVKAM